jgi:hypothetical protein
MGSLDEADVGWTRSLRVVCQSACFIGLQSYQYFNVMLLDTVFHTTHKALKTGTVISFDLRRSKQLLHHQRLLYTLQSVYSVAAAA